MVSWVTRRLGAYTFDLYRYRQHLTSAYSHLNIGAGRIVWQDIVKIDVSIKKRQFHQNPVILESCKHAKETNGRLHFLGLVSASVQDASAVLELTFRRFPTEVSTPTLTTSRPSLRPPRSRASHTSTSTSSAMVVTLHPVPPPATPRRSRSSLTRASTASSLLPSVATTPWTVTSVGSV